MGLGGWFRTIRCEIHTHARYLETTSGNLKERPSSVQGSGDCKKSIALFLKSTLRISLSSDKKFAAPSKGNKALTGFCHLHP